MLPLNLARPLAVFDIESTGTSIRGDRIIDLAIVLVLPGDRVEVHNFRVNPGMKIPEEASRIHGITDADVASCPRFEAVVDRVDTLLHDADLCGYNCTRFDIPLLQEEFLRAGRTLSLEGRRIIDAQRIFHLREPRTLTAAMRFYCNEELVNAHGAEADARATLKVLEGQFARYPDLPHDIDELSRMCDPQRREWVDRAGRLAWRENEVVINFGKRKGERLRDLIQMEMSYVRWILASDFPRDTKTIIENALKNQWPTPPPPQAE